MCGLSAESTRPLSLDAAERYSYGSLWPVSEAYHATLRKPVLGDCMPFPLLTKRVAVQSAMRAARSGAGKT